MGKLHKGFTLVELLVVVTILSILAAVWFVSYSSYLTWARDTARIWELSAISSWLIIYRNKNPLPSPDNSVKILSASKELWLQWNMWKDTLSAIEYSKEGFDPLDKKPYSYYVSNSQQNYQLMGFLEKDKTVAFNLLDNSYANEYQGRFPYFEWDNLWILTNETNTPIQEIDSVKTLGNIDISSTTDIYTVHFNTKDSISWDFNILKFLAKVNKNNWKYCTGKRWIIECPFQKADNIDEYCKSTFYRWDTNQALIDSPSWKICLKAWESWILMNFDNWPWQSAVWWDWCYPMLNDIKYWDGEKEFSLAKDPDMTKSRCYTRNANQTVKNKFFILSENNFLCVRNSVISDSKMCAQWHGNEEKLEGVYY